MATLDRAGFIQERDAALRSLDERQIRAYCRKWGAVMANDPLTFWAGVHRARLSLPSFSTAEQNASREWLIENGFRPAGVGE